MSVKQAALAYGVSQSTLFKYISMGKLNSWSREMDRQTFVDGDEVEELLVWVPGGRRRVGTR